MTHYRPQIGQIDQEIRSLSDNTPFESVDKITYCERQYQGTKHAPATL